MSSTPAAAPGPGWPHARAAGVLLHPTSLPGGRLGPEAVAFVDWLARAGQSFWQILPLAPPDDFGSPYASGSAFAASPLLLADPEARVEPSAVRAFRRRHAYWVDGWLEWLGGGAEAIADQVRFEREWLELRRHARRRGVAIIGDLPIYVARDSADVAGRPDLFDLGRAAGVPPDRFTETGQLWGNPTYRWGAMRHEGFRWWVERFRRALQLVDATRLDHFRGFVAYWAVPHGSLTAEHGRWYRGPGRALFDAAVTVLGPPPLIAEDLGVITPAVDRLREEIAAPGMHVLQFGFGSSHDPHHPSRHREHSVVYTGTHDNAPVGAWWEDAAPGERSLATIELDRLGIALDDPSWAMVELALASRSRLAVVQLQDVLGLGREARMNMPGTLAGNWSWQLERGQVHDGIADRLRAITARHARMAGPARKARRPR